MTEAILTEDAAKYVREAVAALRRRDRTSMRRLRSLLSSEADVAELRLDSVKGGRTYRLRRRGLVLIRMLINAIDNELT
ncbi:MAG: hypothetical protein QW074_06660 [Candidatus Caldarchaeum sp.]